MNELVKKYGEVSVRMGIAHLMDIGVKKARSLTDEQIADMVAKLREQEARENVTLIITPELQGDICRIAREIANMDMYGYEGLFEYIKKRW